VGPGAWALVTQDGVTYELHQPPPAILKPGLQIRILGQIRDDIMSLAMIGPVLEIRQFELI
jgi:hypothetical protein